MAHDSDIDAGTGWEDELLAEWCERFPPACGFKVEIAATGGGCDWLTVQREGDPFYYAATDGDATVPGPGEAFRYVARYHISDTHDDWNGCPLHDGSDIDSAAAATFIRADMRRRTAVEPPPRTVLVHLNVAVHGTDERTAEEIGDAIAAAIRFGGERQADYLRPIVVLSEAN